MLFVIKKKLKNNNGVSFLIAMLLFLVASVVSIVIVTAALSAVKRVHDDFKDQQEYLCVSSAANLIKETLSESSCTIVEKKTISGGSEDVEYTYIISGVWESLLKEAFKNFELYGSSYSSSITIGSVSDGGKEVITSSKMDLTIKPYDSNNGDTTENYKITGRIYSDVSKQNIFVTAWISSPSSTENTEMIYDDNEVLIKKVVTKTTTLVWNGFEMTTLDG